MTAETVVRESGQGTALWMLGGLYEIKASGAETGGALTVIEKTIPAGMGPPPHTLRGTESIYVLDGTVRFQLGEQTVEGRPGSFVCVPEGVVASFEAISDVRVLVLYTPGGIEAFFVEAGEPAPRRELPPAPTGPPDIDRLLALGETYGMQIRPPARV